MATDTAELRRLAEAVIAGKSEQRILFGRVDASTVLALCDAADRERWRPIETAPKPTSEWFTADVWCEHSVMGLGGRYPNASLRENGRWYDAGGNRLDWEEQDDDGTAQYRRATHWRPLPPAPEEK